MSWIQTYTGRKVWPLELEKGDIEIRDIAHSLAMQCRWTGHTRQFFSVAQHSVLVSIYCDPADALWGLLHDASEAYLVDVPRPLKRVEQMAFYRSAEEQAMKVIAKAFWLEWPIPDSVKWADKRLLATEARDLMNHGPNPLGEAIRYAAFTRRIVPWSPEQEEKAFLERYNRLTRFPELAELDRREYVRAEDEEEDRQAEAV